MGRLRVLNAPQGCLHLFRNRNTFSCFLKIFVVQINQASLKFYETPTMVYVIDWIFLPSFPKCICWNPNPQGYGIGKWDFWVVIRPWRSPQEQSLCPCKGDPREIPHPFCQAKTQWEEDHPWTRKWALTRVWIFRYLDPGPPSIQNCETEILVVYEPPNLWYFVRQPRCTKAMD